MRTVCIALLGLWMAACQSTADKLVGTWVQIEADSALAGVRQTYAFRPDKTYRWTIVRAGGDTMQNVTGSFELARGEIRFSDDDTARKATGTCVAKFESANRLRLTEQDARRLSVLFARQDSVR